MCDLMLERTRSISAACKPFAPLPWTPASTRIASRLCSVRWTHSLPWSLSDASSLLRYVLLWHPVLQSLKCTTCFHSITNDCLGHKTNICLLRAFCHQERLSRLLECLANGRGSLRGKSLEQLMPRHQRVHVKYRGKVQAHLCSGSLLLGLPAFCSWT